MLHLAILGASGFVGAELLRLCALHPSLKPAKLFGDSQAGLPLESVHPHLALAYPDLAVESFAPDALEGIDLVFAALPHGKSQEVAPEIIRLDSNGFPAFPTTPLPPWLENGARKAVNVCPALALRLDDAKVPAR